MLARRGLRPQVTHPALPFPANVDDDVIERFLGLLDHYAFRLFMRGAILHPEGFVPEVATGYVTPARARAFAEALIELGLAVRIAPTRVRLVRTQTSFGGTLEWYIGRALARWLGFDVATGVKFHATRVGGGLDVVAAAEGKLVYLEVKASPPEHLGEARSGRSSRASSCSGPTSRCSRSTPPFGSGIRSSRCWWTGSPATRARSRRAAWDASPGP